jgi:hypothetical protein
MVGNKLLYAVTPAVYTRRITAFLHPHLLQRTRQIFSITIIPLHISISIVADGCCDTNSLADITYTYPKRSILASLLVPKICQSILNNQTQIGKLQNTTIFRLLEYRKNTVRQ